MKATYLYPKNQTISFTLIARKHIEILRNAGWEIIEGEVNFIEKAEILPITFVHPMFYPLATGPRSYRRLLKYADTLIGFDVADTDKISPLAAYVASQFDLIFVPTKAIADIYKRSGVISKIRVLPHGIDEKWLRPPREPKHPKIKSIAKLKGKKLLFFLWHSGYRKGADVVAEAFARLVKEFDNVYLILKMTKNPDPFLQFLYALPNVIVIPEWMDEEDLIDLYDVCDIVLVPSRGGGFEVNALEGLARRKIVIVSRWGAFDDYAKDALRVSTKKAVNIFIGDKRANVIHCGYGIDPDPQDLYQRIKYAITMEEVVRKRYWDIWENVRMNYTWDVIGKRFINLLKKHLGL